MLWELVLRYGGVSELFEGLPHGEQPLTPQESALLSELRTAWRQRGEAASQKVRDAKGAGLDILTWESPGYPPALFDDPFPPPPVLFVEGALPPQLAGPSSASLLACALVGPRGASAAATAFTRDLARALAREGVVVVSGLALGVDGAAHEGALEAAEEGAASTPPQDRLSRRRYRWAGEGLQPPMPARTVAVLGGGHAHLHPRTHAQLAKRIVSSGGAVISQWAPDERPYKHRFLERNRVVSGLARVLGVIEPGNRSGTHKTAADAIDQGRELLVTPAAPWATRGQGAFDYLRQGASVLLDADDVLGHFPELLPLSPREVSEQAALQFSRVSTPAAAAAPDLLRRYLVEEGEATLDALQTLTRLPTSDLIALLTRFQLTGDIQATPGGRYRWRT